MDMRFHSVNNDQYHLNMMTADGSAAPSGSCNDNIWETWPAMNYSGNFPEKYNGPANGSGGKYVKLQITIRWTCDQPGSGDTCEILVDKDTFCSGPTCSASSGNEIAAQNTSMPRTVNQTSAAK
jgi:hypothetical protein